MKKILFAIAFIFSGYVASAQTQAATPAPWDINKVLQITNTNFNAGERTIGTPVDYVVEITNISKDSVTLLSAKAGCGCTTPNFIPNQKFGPGQTVKVSISYNNLTAAPYTKLTSIYFDHDMTQQVMLSGVGVAPKQEAAPATPQSASPVKH
ncbi:MAG: DUF1573 domain-containing protein [Chitinophagia bacterium]|jgi:hypothetical protein